jgi:AcrR family transcriptional regulator
VPELQPPVIMCADDEQGDAYSPHPACDAETRKILGAARLVLERSHFRSLKIRQVLAASGTSASNFYRRFPSKAHLLLAVLEDEVRLADHRYRSEVDCTAPIADQLNTWLRYTLGTASGRAHALRTRLFLDRDLLEALPEQIAGLHRIADNQLGEIIRRGMRTGELRPGDPEADAMLMGQLVRGLLSNSTSSDLPGDDDLVARVRTFVLRALGGTH